MRLLGRSLALATVMAVLIASSAFAARPIAGCPAGPGETGTADIDAWRPMTEQQLRDAVALAGGDPDTASAEFDRYDTNADGILCVMQQILPNDASGATTFYVSHDNNSKRP